MRFLFPVALLASMPACGPGAPATPVRAEPRAPTPGFPRVLELGEGRQLRIEAPPQRIVPGNAAAADVVLDLVEPARVAALPRVALTYSRAARDLEGFEGRLFETFSAEALLGFAPDLVVVHPWQDVAVSRLLGEAGVPALTIPEVRSLDEVRRSIELVARALGAEEAGARLVGELDRRIAALAEREAARGARVLAYSNYGSAGTCAGAGTSYDLVIGLAGARNVAAEAGHRGFAELGHEELLTLDPDWIVVGARPDDPSRSVTADHLRGDTVLRELRAVREERVVVVPADLFNTSSHYLVEAAEVLVDELELRGR